MAASAVPPPHPALAQDHKDLALRIRPRKRRKQPRDGRRHVQAPYRLDTGCTGMPEDAATAGSQRLAEPRLRRGDCGCTVMQRIGAYWRPPTDGGMRKMRRSG